MRVLGWQRADKTDGLCGRVARPRTAMTAAAHVAGRSFGHHYIQRPRGTGGTSPG